MKQIHYPELDETVCRQTLENGLEIQVVVRKGFAKKLAYFATNFGAIHTRFRLDGQEYQVPAGVAHYLEHKLFDMPDGRDINQEFAALGASVNAFTGYDMTAYHFSVTQGFPEALKLLLEFVSTPCFTPESVEKERGIIDQEIGMNLDSPDSVIFDRLMEQMYRKHPIRVPILGTRQSIRQITPEILHLCHRAFYTPENMLLCVIGDVDPEQVAQIARQVLGSEKRPTGEKLRDWAEEMTCPAAYGAQAMEVAMPMFTLAFKCPAGGTGVDAIRREMVADLAAEALFGESSQLYLKLYEEGVIDGSFGGGFETVDGCAMLLCSGDSWQPERVKQALLARAKELVAQGIDQERFLQMKRSALGRRIRSLDSFDATCYRLCAYHFSQFDYFRFPQLYREMESRQLCRFLEETVREEGSSLCVITPRNRENEKECCE